MPDPMTPPRSCVEAVKRAYAKVGPCTCTEEALCGICAENVATAERRGAERAAQYCQTTAVVRHGITDYKDMADELANEIRALFPPPGAEVGKDAPICTSCGLRKEKCDGC